MTQERLNGLAIAKINKKEEMTVDKATQKYSTNSPKRMQLKD